MNGRYVRRRLDNGLRVIGVENPALHSFACDVRVHAGPRFELRAHTGLTHFLEHMMIQGSVGFPSSHAIMRAVEDLGGVLDAAAQPESVEIYLAVHRKHWRRGLDILTDVVLHPLFDEQEIEQEKKIVAQEIAEHRDEQQRNISVSELGYSLIFKEGVDELGTRGDLATIARFDRQAVQSQYARFFIPGNMVVSLAGAVDFEQACGVLAESLGGMAPGGEPPGILRTEVEQRRPRAVYRVTEKMPTVDVQLCCRACGPGDERFGAVMALAHVLGGGMSSRLFTRVREERGLVYDVWAAPVRYSDTGSVNVGLTVDRRNLVEAVSATLEVVREFTRCGVSGEELQRYKESIRCGMEILCDRPDRLADWLGRQEVLLAPEQLVTPEEFVARQVALTAEGVHETIRDVLAPQNANLVVVGPFRPAEKEALTQLFPAEEVTASDAE